MEAYLPVLDGPSPTGWIEIIYLLSIAELLPAVDLRHYEGADLKPGEAEERSATREMYRKWRTWFASEYVCTCRGVELELERDVFLVTFLFFMLSRCHSLNIHYRRS